MRKQSKIKNSGSHYRHGSDQTESVNFRASKKFKTDLEKAKAITGKSKAEIIKLAVARDISKILNQAAWL